MSKKYDEIMERVQVTPDMEERVLKNALSALKSSPESVRTPVVPLKKYWPAAACLVVCVALAIALPALLSKQEQSNPPVQLSNPMVEVDTPEALSQAVGIALREPPLPFVPAQVTYTSLGGDIAQITYLSSDGKKALFRQSPGQEDNSGDYTVYTVTLMPQKNVTLKGTEDGYTLALWQEGEYSFSLNLSYPLPLESWEQILPKS